MSAKLPHLIDRWELSFMIKPGIARAVRAATPVARRFVFDAEACAHVGRLLFEASDLVAEQIAFAKPPYDYTYLEMADMRALFSTWRNEPVHDNITTDTGLGLLYSKDRLYTFCANDKADYIPPSLGMFSVGLGHGQSTPLTTIFGPGTDPSERVRDLTVDMIKLSYLLGGMRQPGKVYLPEVDTEYFLGNYDLQSTIVTPHALDTHRRHTVMVDAAFRGGGDLSIGAACMLLIHATKRGVTMDQVPHERRFWRGKQVVYKAHNVVRIKLGVHDTMWRLMFGSRESPRRHDVMGCWMHLHRDARCDHDWVRLPDQDHERYACTKCKTLRTWRQAHVRGDGSKGIVTKVYAVTK